MACRGGTPQTMPSTSCLVTSVSAHDTSAGSPPGHGVVVQLMGLFGWAYFQFCPLMRYSWESSAARPQTPPPAPPPCRQAPHPPQLTGVLLHEVLWRGRVPLCPGAQVSSVTTPNGARVCMPTTLIYITPPPPHPTPPHQSAVTTEPSLCQACFLVQL